jgi:hypothetical protein
MGMPARLWRYSRRMTDVTKAREMAAAWDGMIVKAIESGEPATRIKLTMDFGGGQSMPVRDAVVYRVTDESGEKFLLVEGKDVGTLDQSALDDVPSRNDGVPVHTERARLFGEVIFTRDPNSYDPAKGRANCDPTLEPQAAALPTRPELPPCWRDCPSKDRDGRGDISFYEPLDVMAGGLLDGSYYPTDRAAAVAHAWELHGEEPWVTYADALAAELAREIEENRRLADEVSGDNDSAVMSQEQWMALVAGDGSAIDRLIKFDRAYASHYRIALLIKAAEAEVAKLREQVAVYKGIAEAAKEMCDGE